MATAALTNTPSIISLAESITGWTGDTFSLEPDIKVQGSNSVATVLTPNSGQNQEIYYTGFTAADLSAVHLRIWLNITFGGDLQTEANNGIQIFISDGTNTAYWTIAGSDTYAGGWTQFTVYTGNTPTSGTKPTGNSTRVGLNFEVLTKPRNVPVNAWFDAWYYGDGYTVTGGTSGDEIDWSHIATVDETNAYGVVSEVDGVYFLTGEIMVGDGISTTYFKAENQIAVFKDLAVLSTLYQIIFYDDASALTNIDLSGGVITAAAAQRFTLDASEALINSFDLTGMQISRLDGAIFHAGASITNTVFNDCLQVDPKTSIFTNNTFSNSTATDGAFLFPTDDSNFSDLTFINCDNCVEYDAASDSSTPTFVDCTFDDVSGNYDVNNTSGSAETLYNDGSNANSYNPGGSAVTFSGSVDLKITVTNQVGDLQEGIRVRYEESDGTQIAQGSTSVLGVFSYAIDVSLLPYTNAKIVTRQKQFEDKDTVLTIPVTGFDIPIGLEPDYDINLP